MKRQSIMETYRELQAVKNMNWVSNTPSVSPDPMVMDYTKRNGRKQGLLYNNRIHWMGNGEGKIVSTGFGSTEQYNANRTWILKNFPK